MEKQKMETADMVKENIERIGKLFPHCITETIDKNGNPVHAIDFDKLRQELGEAIVDGKKERYQFTWPLKSQASALANTPTTMTLRPDKESSKNFDTTENLYIEGDNLEVLKVLRETYLGKVKMIYIDPPYNTGKDFVYKDNRFLTQKEMDTMEGKYDEYGNLYITNTETNGRFHTDWLNMVYPRLKAARDLLSDDGVIFISIDDNEVENLRKICDEIFGEQNFMGQIAVIVKPEGRQYGFFAKTHEYILAYAKSIMDTSTNEVKIKDGSFKYFDKKGGFNLIGLRNRAVRIFNSLNRPNLRYPFYVENDIKDENGFSQVSTIKREGWMEVWASTVDGLESVWRWGKETAEKNKDELVAANGKNGEIRIFKKDRDLTTLPKTVWTEKECNSIVGTREVATLIGKSLFDFPKPLELVRRLTEIASQKDSLILDFFSGSGTMAHAVMKLNAEDGGNRKFIMVQLAEETEEGSEARKAGYKNICEIGKERIRRAGEKVKAESGLQGQDLDIGFRVLKLDSSNMKDVSVAPSQIGIINFDEVLDNVKEGRTDLDLLFQIMLNNSIPLSANIEEQTINGHKIYNVDDGDLIAVFDRSVDDKTITEIAKMQPLKFVMREPENSPENKYNPDNIIDNFEQIFDLYSPNTIRRVL